MIRFVLLLLLWLPGITLAQDNRLAVNRFEHDGQRREYLSYVPRGAAELAGPRPLVMVLHGGGGTARQISRGTRRRFDQLADRHGFFVVYPQAIDKLWDTGGGVRSESLSPRRDDLGFLMAVMDRMASAYPIDPSRIFATGISRGGQASFMLACRSGRIRAIGVVAMNLPKQLSRNCRTSGPVGLVLINGTEDPLVPYDGGRVTVFGKAYDQVASVDQTLSNFGARNGCGGAPAAQRIDRVDDGTHVERQDWRCSRAPMSLFKVVGGGHTWPSGRSIIPRRIVGRNSRDIVAADVIWGFFAQFR